MMKSTILFTSIALLLSVAILSIGWLIVNHDPAEGQVSGIFDALSLPGNKDEGASGKFDATSALLWDTEQAAIKYEQNAFERRSIASLTKLMTAMVAIDYGIEWDREADILPNEYTAGSTLHLRPGETVTVRDLFYASVLGSANNATKAYVRASGHSEDEFVRDMNRKAIELGLEQTNFTDVTGLEPDNVSTAFEVAQLAAHAFSAYPDIALASATPEYVMTTSTGREHTLRNSNKLLRGDSFDAIGSKTGYLYEAGYCLVVQGEGDLASRIAVILDSPSEERHFVDIKRLLELPVP